MAQPATISTHTPWRQIGQFSMVALIIVSLPYTVLVALTWRPHPRWTFRQTLAARLIRSYLDMVGRAGVSAPQTLEPGKDCDRFQVIDPSQFPKTFYQGPATSPSVTPSEVGGTWYPTQPKDASDKTRIILWNHGGAFIMGDSRELYCGFLARTLLDHAKADAVFCLEYRLSGRGGRNPFPAALQDVITGYAHLTETLGIPADSITIGGDSAGANLSIAFLRYLEQIPTTGMKRPGAAALLSPWVAPLESLSPTGDYQSRRAYHTDYVAVSNLQLGARSYQGGVDSSNNAYITPLGHPFATAVPLFAHFGECEVLGPGIAAWADEMRGMPGNDVELYCERDAPHDTIAAGNILGWEESARELGSEIGRFISARDRGFTQ